MATIDIYGIIGQDSWWERSCNTAKAVSERLDKIPDGEEITVRINSLGGSVVEGLGIYNLLKARGEAVTTVIVGCAASMAGVIFCAGATAIAPETSLLMIHSPSSIVWGTAEEMRQEAETLDVMRSAMVAAYVEKSGMDEDAVLGLMSKDSWMTGAEAAALGFCEVGEVEMTEPADEGEDDYEAEEYLIMFGAASADKKILKFPDTLKLPAAKERKKFEKLGWKFEQAATGDRFVASAVAAPAAPPKVSPTKKPTDKKKDKPKMAELETPQAIAAPPAAAEIPAEFTARLETAEAQAKAKDAEAIALKAENEKLQRNLTVSAQYFDLRQKAAALRSDLKLKPAKFDALFGGDRASAETLLASPQIDNHLFHLQEALAEAESEAPTLPTSFRVAEDIEDELPPVAVERATAGESPESVKAHQTIVAKAKELGVDPNTREGYLKAMNAVGYIG